MNTSFRKSVFILLSVLLIVHGSCDNGTETDRGSTKTEKPVVYTSFYPLTFFVERLAGKQVTVHCPVPPGADPSEWMPDRDTIKKMQNADLIVINGAGYESWLNRISLPQDRIVNTTRAFEDRLMTHEKAVTHSHGPEGEHQHANQDPHTWMDPVLAIKQLEAVYQVLSDLDRIGDRSLLKKNLQDLKGKLREIDGIYRNVSLSGSELLVASHPSYNYLARRNNFEIQNLTLPPDQKPQKKTRKQLDKLTEREQSGHILWETPPESEVEDWYQNEYHLKSTVISTCEQDPGEGNRQTPNFLTVMKRNAETFKEMFTTEKD